MSYTEEEKQVLGDLHAKERKREKMNEIWRNHIQQGNLSEERLYNEIYLADFSNGNPLKCSSCGRLLSEHSDSKLEKCQRKEMEKS